MRSSVFLVSFTTALASWTILFFSKPLQIHIHIYCKDYHHPAHMLGAIIVWGHHTYTVWCLSRNCLATTNRPRSCISIAREHTKDIWATSMLLLDDSGRRLVFSSSESGLTVRCSNFLLATRGPTIFIVGTHSAVHSSEWVWVCLVRFHQSEFFFGQLRTNLRISSKSVCLVNCAKKNCNKIG